ncbi:DUF2290 domain-containing protein [Herbaspirillum hiltneri]|uniref:DUF2290 domain-containing protein n=1 Tax=Herbaspirillum hiltneri TaxID=341045 RepID=UPI0009F8F116|nr:DUF2290 domain-containing protein [Herbaspirillum hiltneri]
MTPAALLRQINALYSRAILSNLSVKQFMPTQKNSSYVGGDGVVTPALLIGDLPSTSALKNIAYADIYDDINLKDAYHIKLPDGGLISFQYIFELGGEEKLIKHRLAYFPCSVLPTIEEAPELYERDELFGDILMNRIVRFPIRIDYDPKNHKEVFHPKCHLTLGQFQECRIPIAAPVMPYVFLLFVVRNFYSRLYKHNMNIFEKRMPYVPLDFTITESERRISHFVMGRNRRSEYVSA